ncbi:MAG TPA: IclR family transcriptional regulator [Syntrophorhabdaceae bacterium]|nr:IclR family transcriptional regulator [Syntrophorhabdaceae bacterium]
MYEAPIIKKAIDILLFIINEKRPVGVTEISKALSISKSTSYGILKALLEKDVISKDYTSKKYFIGRELVKIAKTIHNDLDIIKIARPYLERLSEIVDETVFLGIKDKDTIRIIDIVEVKKSYKISSQVGTKIPLPAGATGKILFSTMKDDEILSFLGKNGLQKFTKNSITDVNAFLKEIRKARKTGYAVDYEEYLKGVNAIATYVHQHNDPLAFIWIVGFSNSLTRNKIKETIKPLKEVSKTISERLSFKPNDDG